MKEFFSNISEWEKDNKVFAKATVIKTWGSSPRPVGSTMLIGADGTMLGSVSGGCVEGAVVKAALDLIDAGMGKVLHFGVTDEEAWAVGLSCGGAIQVHVERFLAFDERVAEQGVWADMRQAILENKGCVLVSRIEEGEPQHFLMHPDGRVVGMPLSDHLAELTMSCYKERKNQVVKEGELSYFVQVFPRKKQLLAIGAAHITVDLVDLAQQFGFETIVIDPRGAFANNTKFTSPPDQIIEKYPSEVLNDLSLDAYTFVTVLSHDPKIDDNALHILLKSEVAYIGALGSRRTHAKRVARLQEAGFDEKEIARIHAPIGMDINAKSTREIALSIMGEMVKVGNQYL